MFNVRIYGYYEPCCKEALDEWSIEDPADIDFGWRVKNNLKHWKERYPTWHIVMEVTQYER